MINTHFDAVPSTPTPPNPVTTHPSGTSSSPRRHAGAVARPGGATVRSRGSRRPGAPVVLAFLGTLVLAGQGAHVPDAEAVSPDIVISQVYGGGGNSGATYTHDFVELFNRGTASVSLAGWSIQYASATGTGNFGSATNAITELPAISLAPGQYLLIQEAQGTGGTTALPTPDVTDATPIAMSASGGKIALVNTTTPLGCNGASTPCSPAALATIVDLVGYGSANFFEGAGATPAPSNTTAVLRAAAGCIDTDDNATDFAAGAPAPRNTASPLAPCASACGDPATFIHDIQGSGATSPIDGMAGVFIEGVVVGDYQQSGGLGGFFVQEEDADADADPATSEGIFVFNTSFPVNAGDVVRVRGTVAELSGLTALRDVSSVLTCATGVALPAPTSITLPVASLADLERYEGMLVSFPQKLTVTDTFNLGRFGEVDLAAGRLFAPTSVVTPGPAAMAAQDLNDLSRIILDDANNQQNIDPTLYPTGGLSATNTLRSGDTVTGLTGILDWRFGAYRVQPVGPITFTSDNPRSLAPDPVGGSLRVATMSLTNYFTTLDTGGPVCGPTGVLECRGADSAVEFTRQRDKLLSALLGVDADVLALTELENNPTASLQDLVDGLNDDAGPGTYAFVDTGTIGTDAVKVGLIYKPASVTPVGAHAILDSTVDPRFDDTLNRPALAQTFEQSANGQRFTVVTTHLKSKGSACAGDPDTGDGQGNCNATRTSAAAALVDWLHMDPTGSGDPDFLIIGDLNSYAKEDPVTAITSAGYTDLVGSFVGSGAYSFVFDGQSGYLDHALASSGLAAIVTGVTQWHIDADEPVALDYNVEFKSANHVTTLYDPGPYRASDVDPLVVGLCQPPTLSVSASPGTLSPPNHKYVTVKTRVTSSADVTAVSLISATSSEPDNGLGDGDTPDDIVIMDDRTIKLRAERSGRGSGRVYTLTYQATSSCGATVTASATVTVPHSGN